MNNNYKKQPVIKIFIIILAIFIAAFNSTLDSSKTIAVLTIIVSVVGAYTARNDWNFFVIYSFIAYANYSICMANYLVPINNYLTSLQKNYSAIAAVNILFIFSVLLLVIQPKIPSKAPVQCFFNDTPSNSLISGMLIVLLVLIYFYGFTKPNQPGERGSTRTIYEYSIILFILAFFYSKGKAQKLMLSAILAMYAIQNLQYGGRVTAVQLIICWFLIMLQHKVTFKMIVPFLLPLLVIFTGIGSMRANFDLSTKTFWKFFDILKNGYLINDTSYSAFFTSQTFLLTEEFTVWWTRLGLFVKFLLSMIVGGSVISDSNLAVYTHQFYLHYYGGILPFFGHFYLGYFGVGLIAACLSNLFKKFTKSEQISGVMKCIKVYVVSTCPRWYLYSPSSLLRGVLLMVIVYFVLDIFRNIFFQREKIFLKTRQF